MGKKRENHTSTVKKPAKTSTAHRKAAAAKIEKDALNRQQIIQNVSNHPTFRPNYA